MRNLPSPTSLATMVNSVTTTMMNVKFALVSPQPQPSNLQVFRRAVLPIPGSVPVAVMVAGDESSCQKLGARLFSMTAANVDVTMMEDTLRELANITAGQVKRAMAIDAALGLPKILTAAEPWDTSAAGQQLIVLRADTEDIHLEVQIAAQAA